MLIITGASGFIGQNLFNKLASSSITISRNPINNKHHLSIDLTNKEQLINKLKNVKFNKIIHLAAATYNNNSTTRFKDNILMMRNLIELAQNNNNTPIIYISTFSACYKDDAYAKTKREAEKILQNSPIPHTILRPTMIIGRNSKDIDKFKKLLHFGIIPLANGGKQKIQPIKDESVTEWIIHFINGSQNNDKYIIAGNKIITTHDFIDQYIRRNSNIIPIPKSILLNPLTKQFPQIYENLKTFTLDLTPETLINKILSKTEKFDSIAYQFN